MNLVENDLVVYDGQLNSQMSTVLMIDISHSMILYGEDRITPAKNVAMALSELITTRYPKDTLDIIVFGNDARPIPIKELPYLKVGPYHTNTVAGLELALEILRRKKTQPKKNVVPDPKFNSTIIPKLINNIMYDGKRGIAAKIVYEAIDKIKTKTKDEPINIFNEAINNIKPTVEVRSRRVGGATYQVPVEVKSKRAQALAIRWLVESARKRKDKHMADKIFNELYDAYEKKGAAVKKREDVHKMAESNKAFAHFRW